MMADGARTVWKASLTLYYPCFCVRVSCTGSVFRGPSLAKPSKVIPMRRRKSTSGRSRRFFVGFLLSSMLLMAIAGWYAFGPLTVKPGLDFVHISPKQGALAVGQELQAQGIELHPRVFAVLAQTSGVASRLKAGSFELPPALSAWGLVKLISRGDVRFSELSVIEGWSFQRFRQAVNQHAALRHETLKMSDAELMAALKLDGRHPEGLFFPDTYLFPKNASDLQLFEMAQKRMAYELDVAWALRHPDVPLKSPYEALIMASIIEKETGLASDRKSISSVFANRLRKGMMLQTDPTVIYGIGEAFDGDLRRRDLRADTPYNTYTRNGLPPTPISLPGRDALLAAVQPANSPFVYFVAKGDGSSYFSSTLDEHNKAVDRYIRNKRKAGTP